MTKIITPFDVAEHLETRADVIDYLNLCLEDNDPKLVTAALGHIGRAGGMTHLARDSGVSADALQNALEDENPDFATILRVITALGLRLSAHEKPRLDAG